MKIDYQKPEDVLIAEREAIERARELATLAANNGDRKVFNPPVDVDGQKFAVVDDGATIRTFPV